MFYHMFNMAVIPAGLHESNISTLPSAYVIPYSLKFSRTKIFVDFVVFEAPTKIYP